MINSTENDWWQRERQRFLKRVLIGLILVLTLIGYFAYVNSQGRIGYVHGINFDTTNYIAFVRRENDGSATLYAVSADGTDLRRLTNTSDPSNKEHPCWTTDGKSLVYASNLKDSRTMQLYILGDGTPLQLTYGSGNKFSPVVSPNGKEVVFITQGVVKTVSITGTDVMQVMPPPRSGNEGDESGVEDAETAPYLSAALASDGATLAGIRDVSNVQLQIKNDAPKDSPSEVNLLPVDQQLIVLPDKPDKRYPPLAQGHEVSMAWEPFGSRLACTYTEFPMLDEQGNPVDVDKKPLPKKTPAIPMSGIRIWSFENYKPQAKNIFACIGYSAEPKNIGFSPDGTKLVYELWFLKADGQREPAGIRIMDMTQEHAMDRLIMPQDIPSLTYLVPATPEGKPQNPRWSPDSRRIVYEMVRPDGKRDLWVINADGTTPINLTKGKGDNTDAAWAPPK